ncbi:cadherin repeat domain-containing protein, partial [Neptunomonas phycophila]|uniref:cadherin repeat domain-containing protein n=2 Tax=Oceanospirillaceae TaxID=135620 RepID=UPI003511829E
MSAKKYTRLQTPTPQLLQLEQRLMFDGAAVDTAADTVADHLTDTSANEVNEQIFQLAVAYGNSQVAAEQAQQQIKDYLAEATTEALFDLFNGTQSEITVEWMQSMESLRESILNGDAPITVETLTSEHMNGALAAFTSSAPSGEAIIYLNQEWVASTSNTDDITRVLVEEYGHFIDASVNMDTDTQGDEGQRFAASVTGHEITSSSFATDNDQTTIDIDGESISVETADNTFDVEGNPLVFNTSTLLSGNGTDQGSSYLYTNLITIDGQSIDAIVTLSTLSNATVDAFDSTVNPYADTASFQPNLTINSAGGYADFTFRFILGGSYNAGSNPTGTLVTLRNVLANSYDLDGTQADANGRQYTEFENIGGYTLSTSTQLVRSEPSSGVTRFVTTVGGNIGDAPGTTAGDNIRVLVSFDELSETTIQMGDTSVTGIAYYGIDFSEGPAFVDPNPVDVIVSSQSIITSEDGATGSFDITLASQPNNNVTVTLSGLDASEGSLSTTTLTFTSANWNTPQTVTVTGVDDVLDDGDITYSITATTSSADSAYEGRTAIIDVTNQDNDDVPPVITGPSGAAGDATSTASIAENETAITTLTADETVTWSVVGGVDQSFFSIDSNTGNLSFNSSQDFESPADDGANNTYIVQVQALDANGNTSTQTVTTTVTNVDEVAPAFSSGATANADENQPLLYTAAATDTVDFTDQDVTYSLKDPGVADAALLSIDGTTGAVTLTSGNLDFESKSSYVFTVIATDDTGNASEQPVTVTVNDLDEIPP